MYAAAWLAAMTLAQGPWTFGVAIEPARESLRYRFENPSSFSTVELVPHFFVQTYDTDNLWATARAAHPLFGRRAEARLSMTASATRQADDFDTFVEPDGNVAVSGTTGNASLRAWAIEERITTGRYRGADLAVRLSYRRDTARYHEGTRIVTTTRPPSRTETLIATREFVSSQLIDVGFSGVMRRGGFASVLDVVPAGYARLAIDLPDKYPGRTIVRTAPYSSLGVEISAGRAVGPATARAGARFSRVFGWRNSASVRLQRAALFLEVSTH